MSFAQDERARWAAAAQSGEAEAQFRMGQSYCCGDSGYFDTDIAVSWWCRAAAQGHVKAREALQNGAQTTSCSADGEDLGSDLNHAITAE